jgi:hypothetical protein
MKRILRRRPSPALIISAVALFVALGGTAYALTITGANVPDNALSGTDIRDIKGGDIRNYSITGKDIGKDSLGRIPIKEERLESSKIGEVKVATEAKGFAGLSPKRYEAFTLDTNGTRELLRAGPLVFTARCREDAGNQIAEVVVQTNANGVAVDGAQKDANLQTTETAVFVNATAPLGTPQIDQESSGVAIAADGTEVLGQDFYAGTSVLGQPNKCRFGGVLYTG